MGSTENTVADEKPKSIMKSLGEFFGHIAHGIRTDPTKKEVSRTVEETRRDDGVILRRTVIEEVELRPGQIPPASKVSPASHAPPPAEQQTEASTKDAPPHAPH